MPKPDPVKNQEPEEKEPEVQIVSSEEHKPAEVEVDLEPQKKGDAAPDPTEKLRNQMFYEQRQMEKRLEQRQKQMIDEMISRMSGSKSQPNGTEKLDEFDEEVERIAQTDWRKAVDMRAERIAERKLEEKLKAQEAKRQEDESRQAALRIEARGREKVLKEFPNIMDESTPEFRTYMELYNREVSEDPLFMYNPRKHELILPELKERIKSSSSNDNPEIERLKRVAAGSGSPSRSTPNSNKVMLTQDEIEMCKRSGISVESYARTKKLGAQGLKEGIVIDESV